MLESLQRLYPEVLSNSDLTNRFGLSKGQIWAILTGLIAAGLVRKIGKNRGTLYVALEGLPAHRRIGNRPRHLGFGAEWRRRYLASQAVEVEVSDDGSTPAAVAGGSH